MVCGKTKHYDIGTVVLTFASPASWCSPVLHTLSECLFFFFGICILHVNLIATAAPPRSTPEVLKLRTVAMTTYACDTGVYASSVSVARGSPPHLPYPWPGPRPLVQFWLGPRPGTAPFGPGHCPAPPKPRSLWLRALPPSALALPLRFVAPAPPPPPLGLGVAPVSLGTVPLGPSTSPTDLNETEHIGDHIGRQRCGPSSRSVRPHRRPRGIRGCCMASVPKMAQRRRLC